MGVKRRAKGWQPSDMPANVTEVSVIIVYEGRKLDLLKVGVQGDRGAQVAHEKRRPDLPVWSAPAAPVPDNKPRHLSCLAVSLPNIAKLCGLAAPSNVCSVLPR